MTDTEIFPEEPQDTIDLLDDVEGHGLKEVAAGLGAAAVLAGGAAGATQLASSSIGVHPSTGHGTSASVSVSDPVQTVNDTTDSTITAAQTTRDTALAKADSRVDKAGAAVQSLPSDVTAAAAGLQGTASTTLHATKGWATDVAGTEAQAARTAATTQAHEAASTATSKADRSTARAETTVSSTSTTAGTTARDADRKVATVLTVVTTTATDGVHTAKVTVKAVDAGAGADTSAAGGWVLVKAGDTVLAQVHLSDGGATASWTMPMTGEQSVQISYTGDQTFAPSARTMPVKPI